MNKFLHILKAGVASMAMLCALSANGQSTVLVNFKCQRFLGDVSELDRTKFFNIHTVPSDTYTEQDMQDLKEWGITFGRQFWGPYGRYSDYIEANGEYPSEERVIKDGANNINYTKGVPYYKHITSQVVVTDHPKSMIRMDMDPVAGGQMAATYFEHFYEDHLRPLYYEPVNEPFVHAGEYLRPGDSEADVRYKTAEYFREVGKAFDEKGIETNVVGYSSAWPSMELWDFEHWETRMKMFMDVAGDYMDGFSIHLYDGINVEGQATERSGNNSDAILDLVETYSKTKWNVVKPHAITEYGGIPDGYGVEYSDVASIQTIKSTNHLMFGLMEREDRLMISIPFNTGKSPWFHKDNDYEPYGADLWKPVKSSVVNGVVGEYEFTAKRYFYDLWKGVQGKRVKCSTTNEDVEVRAFLDGNKAYVCINNYDHEDQEISLEFMSSLGDVQNINARSLKIYQQESPIYKDQNITEIPSSIQIEAHETIIFTYTLKHAPEFVQKLVRKEYYSDNHLKSISANSKMTFDFNNVELNSDKGEAELRMGIGRKHDVSKRPEILVNGNKVTVPTNYTGYDQANRDDFFGVIKIPVPFEYIQENNTVEVTFPDKGGHLSTMVLSVSNLNDVAPQTPYLGDAFTLPTKVETEHFDLGGEGIAYHTLDDVNDAGEMRTDEAVEIISGGTEFLTDLKAGEWLEYTVNVAKSATYNVALNGLAVTKDAKVYFVVDNEKVTEDIEITSNTLADAQTSITLGAGSYPVRLYVESGNAHIDYLDFTLEAELTDAIGFATPVDHIRIASEYNFTLDYTASTNRDMIVELWTESTGLIAREIVSVEEGTSSVDVTMEEIARPFVTEKAMLKARIVQTGSESSIGLAEAVINDITLEVITSSDNLVNTEIKCFPNPVTLGQSLFVESSEIINSITVYDIQGKKYDTFQFSGHNNKVKLELSSRYHHGLYILKIEGPNYVADQKLMVN